MYENLKYIHKYKTGALFKCSMIFAICLTGGLIAVAISIGAIGIAQEIRDLKELINELKVIKKG